MKLIRSVIFIKKKDKVKLTNHSKKRGKQRSGLHDAQMDKQANRAYYHGIIFDKTIGELRHTMSNAMKNHYGSIPVYYANCIYIFHHKVLVTVLECKDNMESNLYKYINSFDNWLSYKNHRRFIKSNNKEYLRKLNSEEINACLYYILQTANKYLKDQHVPLDKYNIMVFYSSGKYNILYAKDEDDKFELKYKQNILDKSYKAIHRKNIYCLPYDENLKGDFCLLPTDPIIKTDIKEN